MMGIAVPENFWAYKKYNKIISNIQLVLFFSYRNDAPFNTHHIPLTCFDCDMEHIKIINAQQSK